MKGIYIPDYKCAFITANKSGSRCVINTLIMFFEYNNISYEKLIGSNYNVNFNTKYYILVRNPINRFFTTYSWLMRDISKVSDDEFNIIQNVLKKYNIQTIEDYAINYKKLYDDLEFDTHFFEQYFSFIPPPNYKNNGINISRLELKKMFDFNFKNYEFIQIEKLNDIVEHYKNNYILSDDDYISAPTQFMIDTFSEFNNLTNHQKKLSNIFYNYIMQILDSKHHNKIETQKYKTKYKDIIINKYMHLFKTEMVLYGYKNTPTII
jgi:hypothetical protein